MSREQAIKLSFRSRVRKDFAQNGGAYLIALPVLLWYLLFHYAPMYGAIIAFKQFNPAGGILRSPWVGLANFRDFFHSYYFTRLIGNTLSLSALSILFVFPAPIILALLLNELRTQWYKRTVQTITYVPHFISIVVICGMIIDFVKKDGVITTTLNQWLRIPNDNLLLYEQNFRPIYIISEMWQNIGWSSIIFLAALTAIDPELYDAATIDGAGKWRQTWHITLPGIQATIIILLVLRLGAVMNVGYEKVMLLYNPTIYTTSDVISTFVYRRGLLQADYSYAAAVGLFNSLINCLMVVFANKASQRYSEYSLW